MQLDLAGLHFRHLDRAVHLTRLEVARAHCQHAQSAQVFQLDIAGAHLGSHAALGATNRHVAGTHIGAHCGGAVDLRIAGSHVELHQHRVGHAAAQIQVGVAVAEGEPAVIVQGHHQLVADAFLGHGQALEQLSPGSTGASAQFSAAAGRGVQMQVVGSDLEQDRLHAGQLQVQAAWFGEFALLLCRCDTGQCEQDGQAQGQAHGTSLRLRSADGADRWRRRSTQRRWLRRSRCQGCHTHVCYRCAAMPTAPDRWGSGSCCCPDCR